MLVKICGLTNSDTAYQAVLRGADLIGLLFSSCSPRQISLAQAQVITDKVRQAGGDVVGVFVNESYSEVAEIIATLQLRYVQLHGDSVYDFGYKLAKHIRIIYLANGKPLPDYLNAKRDFVLFDKITPYPTPMPFFIAGGLNASNVVGQIAKYNPAGVDASSQLESSVAVKDIVKIEQFMRVVKPQQYGKFGGRFVAELLITPLKELEQAYRNWSLDAKQQQEYKDILHNALGRPTPVTEVKNFADAIYQNAATKPRIFLKREDLLHTGAHKINNALGQCLLAKYMGKTRIIAETGAGQHGVATATACAMLGLACTIYMGSIDIERQSLNVQKMQLLGAQVIAVKNGSATLKDAVNEALRDWAHSFQSTHYCLGSALGPHPFPQIVADLQAVIGNEAITQMAQVYAQTPTHIVACVGGGSNAIGIFAPFISNSEIKLIGVEAGGSGSGLGNNAARFAIGSIGVLHGTKTYLLQDSNYQVSATHSVSAGLDYPAVGPQHAYLHSIGRVTYDAVTDDEALAAFKLLIKTEGIIPALESSHALAYIIKHSASFNAQDIVLVNLSGRGDKDMDTICNRKVN